MLPKCTILNPGPIFVVYGICIPVLNIQKRKPISQNSRVNFDAAAALRKKIDILKPWSEQEIS